MPPYVWFAFVGAIGLAASGLVAKIMVRYRICNADLVTWSIGLGASIAALTLWIILRPPFPSLAAWPMFGLVGSLLLAGLFLNRAIQEGDASMVLPLLSMKIPVTALLAFLILDESHTPSVYAAVVLSAGAMALFGLGRQEAAQGGHGRHPVFALALAVLAACVYATADQMAKLALGEYEWLSVALWGHMLLGPFCLAMLFNRHYRQYRVGALDIAVFLCNGFVLVGAVCGLYIAFEAADGVTVPNVILGSRGLFVLAAGYLLRGALKVPMERQPPSVYALRAAGTILFLLAILLVSSAG